LTMYVYLIIISSLIGGRDFAPYDAFSSCIAALATLAIA